MYFLFALFSYLVAAFSNGGQTLVYLIASLAFAALDVWDRKPPKHISHMHQNIFPKIPSGEKSEETFNKYK